MEAQEEKTCEEYQSMVKDKVAEAEWKYLDVSEHWQQMKNILLWCQQVQVCDVVLDSVRSVIYCLYITF